MPEYHCEADGSGRSGGGYSATRPSLCVWQVGAVSGINRLVPWSHQVPSLVLKLRTEQRVSRCSATLGSVWIGKQVAQHLQSGSPGFIGFLSGFSSRSKRSQALRCGTGCETGCGVTNCAMQVCVDDKPVLSKGVEEPSNSLFPSFIARLVYCYACG